MAICLLSHIPNGGVKGRGGGGWVREGDGRRVGGTRQSVIPGRFCPGGHLFNLYLYRVIRGTVLSGV